MANEKVSMAWDIFAEVSGILTEMGGKGSGHYGHKGVKGHRGGSASSGGFGGRMFVETSRFNEKEEYLTLFEEPTGQQNKPKPGVTRDQMQRFFDRVNAVKTARQFKYKGNVSLVEEVDTILSELGVTKYAKKSGNQVELRNPKTDKFWVFRRKVETDYLKTIFNKDEFKRNY